MKISRSNIVEFTITLTMFLVVVSSAFIFANGKNDVFEEKIYVLNEEVKDGRVDNTKDEELEEKVKEEIPEEEIDPIVYDNMTLTELSDKLNKSLNSDMSGYGNFIASYTIEKGIDPYLATAIILHETGCTWECSRLVKECHNVGGMKGSGCGSYGYFNTLEEGIQRFVDNIYNNYYVYGLTDAYSMNSKYAEDPEWSIKVNNHIEKIKNR